MVIGGGIGGMSVAARLAPEARVVVLEAEDGLGYHSTGRSAALFEQSYGLPTTRELNRASHAELAAFDGEGVLSPRGLLLVGTAETAEAFRRDLREMAMEPVSPEQARRMVPILHPERVVACGHHAEAWDIDVDRLLQGHARRIRAHGGEIRLRAPVTGLLRRDGNWHVTAGGETLAARVLVNAAGAWADRVAALAGVRPIGLRALRRSMARLPAPGGHDLRGWPMLLGAGESWYAKPDAGKLLVSPAEEDPVEPHDCWAEDLVLAEGLARYEAAVTEPVTRVEARWAGLRSFVADRQLVIGFAADAPGFFWHAALGGYGIQTSPAASRLAADLICGRSPELGAALARALSPARLA